MQYVNWAKINEILNLNEMLKYQSKLIARFSKLFLH
ncbi:MAG: hypothetical protein ACOYND_10505 [Bacteroidota bacterium]